ncbi:MAG TPA: colanic acid biosynthesis glycosyltransferase WcaI [Leclercia adecarboxylata]|nr:colanic acid biosynthesis glycosyltransferase WcaI [Leclercia adecarboxylata]
MPLNTVEELVADIRAGKMVILMDDEDRENEGDLVIAATHVRPEDINFMITHARGLVCLTLSKERCQQLNLPLMVDANGAQHGTNFTLSIEAAEGISTGISPAERAHTIQTAVAAHAKPADIVQPGHIFPLMAQRRWKPDRIIGVVPTLFCTPGMRLLGKLSGARTLLHIQDYEVDAMLGLGMAGKGKGGKVARLASAFERSGLHNVDYVSTISRSMMNKAQEKGVAAEKVIFFPNWSEVARFRDVAPADVAALRAQLGLAEAHKIVLYSGNIGEKQGLENVIDAAAALSDKPWQFVIVGQGGGKARLEKMARERGLQNIQFFPLQSYDALPALLKMADCHLVVQKRGAADAVLPSKLTNILAVGGNAVITAEAHTELGQLCTSLPGIAVCVEPESVPALVAGIEQALTMPKENTVARDYAERTIEKENVLSQFIADIRG